MANRVEILSLTDFGGTAVPNKVVLNCSFWSLRMIARVGSLVNGVPVENIGKLDPSGDYAVALDFPPVFDRDGVPVPWNDEITFLFTGAVNGSIVQTYLDPVRPRDRV